jgi:hypothetical protein
MRCAHAATTTKAARFAAPTTGLVRRFEADLDDERDVLLSRGGALMLLQRLEASGG